MSSLILEVCRIDAVNPHPNADRMAIATVKGWYTCIGRDPETAQTQFQPGDAVVYFPPDVVLPAELAERLNVAKYLGSLPANQDGTRPSGGRVRVTNLRGFKSYGFLIASENPAWEIGTNVAEHYGVRKYEPPIRSSPGEHDKPHPAFHRYFDMENIRNFPTMLTPGEAIIATEKIHGENTRLGLIRDTNDAGEMIWRWMAGSHDVRRKRFQQKRSPDGQPVGPPIESVYWRCFSLAVRSLLCELSGCGYTPEEIDTEPPVRVSDSAIGDVVLFGERFGSGVQDMWYGHTNGGYSFRAFDVTINGRYQDFAIKEAAFHRHGVAMVPILYRGPYQFAIIEALAEGPTAIVPDSTAQADSSGKNFREGIVVLAEHERAIVTPTHVFERPQVKCISFAYLARKDGTEYH